jgi:hypothetical protein
MLIDDIIPHQALDPSLIPGNQGLRHRRRYPADYLKGVFVPYDKHLVRRAGWFMLNRAHTLWR